MTTHRHRHGDERRSRVRRTDDYDIPKTGPYRQNNLIVPEYQIVDSFQGNVSILIFYRNYFSSEKQEKV